MLRPALPMSAQAKEGMNPMKKLFRILFHRTAFVIVALVAQVSILLLAVTVFSDYIPEFYWCCIFISVVTACHCPQPDGAGL